MKQKKRKGVDHIVFDDENEFTTYFGSNHPPLVRDWKEAQEGDWVLAMDGGVVQVLKRGELPHPHDRKNYKAHKGWMRTIVGTFIINDKTFFDTDFDNHPQPYTFSNRSNAEIKQRWKVRENLSKAERIFVANLQAGKPMQVAYEDAFSAKVDWREHAIAILKTERVRKELNKNLEEIADSLGLSYEYILSHLMKLVEEAKNDNVKLGSLRELKDWIKEEQDTVKKVESAEVNFFEPFGGEEILAIEAERVNSGE
jgi:hypothetical protein